MELSQKANEVWTCENADSFSAFRTRDCLHWRTVLPSQNGCLDKGPKKKKKKKSFSRNCMGKGQQRKHSGWHSVFQEQRHGFNCTSALSAFSYAYVRSPCFKKTKPSNTKTNQSTCKKESKETRSIASVFCLLACVYVCVSACITLYSRKTKKKEKKTIQCK